MAPKQKATDGGQSSNSKSSSSHHNSHGNSEGRSHANGNSSERGGNSASHDRASSSGANNNSNTANSSSHGAGGASANGSTEKGGSSGHAGGSSTTGSGTKRKAESPLITMDFNALDLSALRRYCRLNHLTPKTKTRESLVAAATAHWNNTKAQEVDSAAYFLFAVKHRHNVLKLTMPLS